MLPPSCPPNEVVRQPQPPPWSETIFWVKTMHYQPPPWSVAIFDWLVDKGEGIPAALIPNAIVLCNCSQELRSTLFLSSWFWFLSGGGGELFYGSGFQLI